MPTAAEDQIKAVENWFNMHTRREYPNLSSLAVNGFALFAPTQQLAKPRVAHLDMQPEGQPSLVRRIKHLFGHKLGVELPDVLTLALSGPDQSIADHLTAEVH